MRGIVEDKIGKRGSKGVGFTGDYHVLALLSINGEEAGGEPGGNLRDV